MSAATPGHEIGGRYRLLDKLGEGGFGAVWVAERADGQPVDGNAKVALKLLHPRAAADNTAVERFFREIEAASQIGHTGICRVYDSGIDEGRPFLVMELLEGRSLRDCFADATCSIPRRLQLLEGVLEPLAAAHQQGFVHRDLKPENIFVTHTGSVKLLDFGLARQTQSESHLTATGTALGTAYYMSPEQARSAKDAGAPTDVWAFGVMLREAMTGLRPFEGSTAADVIVKVCTEPAPPFDLPEGVPSAVGQLVEWCLRKKPEQRPRDAMALRSAYGRARRGEAPSGEFALDQTVDAIDSAAILPPQDAVRAGSTGRESGARGEDDERVNRGRTCCGRKPALDYPVRSRMVAVNSPEGARLGSEQHGVGGRRPRDTVRHGGRHRPRRQRGGLPAPRRRVPRRGRRERLRQERDDDVAAAA